ncbi:PET and/or LIM domain containing protein [Asbolus verrucosus]|uniref:PET and/or LIM domain containing protein n=1 Tax=Asbolus verrucosus TaxID=1661398 RepID=A0A482VBR5_ASBVE|nr:PET and/or LIM domain containing protein [Asbolus verrucosus]
MSEESENVEVPNWLSELEKKREKRVKARLGHEAGAGAPCIKCESKCPGLDLHFWRKICKNCKCSKEDHDVHDDDIYGWAQFQLLGSKPNRIKKKIVLPGKKDEVELDWAPKGNTETIDRYLKTLSPESLPVKGSQAAQARKQLLQKQIPIHDIDPSLCHELTDSELVKMQDYIKHMKSSAGVGQVIQFGLNYGNYHTLGKADAKFVANRYPKGIPSIETVQLLGEKKSTALTKQFEKLGVKDQKELDAFFDKIPNPHNMAAYSEKLGYISPQTLSNPTTNYVKIDPNSQNLSCNYAESQNLSNSDPNYASNLDSQKTGYVRGDSIPIQNIPSEINRNSSGGASQFIRENILNDPQFGYGEDLTRTEPNYAQQTMLANQDGRIDAEINRNSVNLPHYAPGKLNIHGDQQNPTKIGNIRDLAFSTHDQSVDLANSNYKGLQAFSPNQHKVPEDQLVPNRVNIGAIKDITYDNPEIKSAIQGENKFFDDGEIGRNVVPEEAEIQTKHCRKCSKQFLPNEFAIFVEKSDSLYHSSCFKCAGCNQSLADLFYFYDKESDNIYCGRDFAKIRGIPRCKACDELIFVKEYCLAENSTFHLKHFCCFECDQALAGQNYVVEDSQPVCLPCYEKVKANKCVGCLRVIGPDEEGVALAEGIHFHATDGCFCCKVCRKPLRGSKLLFRNKKLYCSHDCFKSDQ